MRSYVMILVAIIFVGCSSDQKELATKEFIDSVFILDQRANGSWAPDLNSGLSEESFYFNFMRENELALGYLQWNLIDEKLPDSIKYSTKEIGDVQTDFHGFVNQDEEIVKAIRLLIYPDDFKDDHQIDIDSIVNVSSKLFFASSEGKGRVGWKLCAGKSKFPEIYGESKNYASVIIQALCFQAIFENRYSNLEKTIWDSFNENISEVSSEMNEIEYHDYIDTANQLMWKKMSQSDELRSLISEFTSKEHSKLYFQISTQ